MKGVLFSVAIGYALICLFLFIFQRNLIYYPNTTPVNQAVDWGMKDMNTVDLHTEDGLKLVAWYQKAKSNMPTLLYFHGNGGNLVGRRAAVMPYIEAGYGVLLVSYRGYGGNPGSPSEQGLYQDARAAIRYLEDQNIKPSCIIAYGESLGTGVAIQVATEYPLGAVILRAPYTNLGDVGQVHYSWLPVKWFIRDKYDSLSKIKNVHSPILIFYATRDKVIPPKLTETLYAQANEPKQIVQLRGSHSNLDLNTMFKISDEFLQKLPWHCAPGQR